MMSWGIMFLALSLNASTKKALAIILVFLCLLSGVNAWCRIPYSEQELKRTETLQEKQVRELRDQEIDQLRMILGRRAPAHRRADLYQRLSELYREAYQSEFLLEGRVHELRLDQGMLDPQIDRTHSVQLLKRGIQACLEVLSLKIADERLDEIYFSLGFYYGELDQQDLSAQYYESLIQKFPESSWVGSAYQSLGEIYYHRANYAIALRYYQKALPKLSKKRSLTVMHKLAWCYFRTRQVERAISMLKDLTALASSSEDQGSTLRDEALRDLAIFFPDRVQPDEAVQYFQKQAFDQNLYPQLLGKLADQYERNLDLEKAKQVYEILIKTHPSSSSAFKAFIRLVEIDLKQSQVKNAVQRFHQYTIPSQMESDLQDLLHNLRVNIRRLATEAHQNYRKKKEQKDLDAAHELYQIYIQHFLNHEDSHRELPEIQIYLAEIKRELGRRAEAVQLYRQVIHSQDARLMKQARLLWMETLGEMLRKSPQQNPMESPSPIEQEYVQASDLIQEVSGNTDEGRSAALRAAQLLAAHPQSLPDAVSRMRRIIQKWPSSPQALTAAGLWLQIYLDHDRRPGLDDDFNHVLHELLGQSELLLNDEKHHQSQLKSALQAHLLKLKIDEITADEKAHKFTEAAQKELSLIETLHDPVFIERSYRHALQNLIQGEASFSQIQLVLEQWAKRYPKSRERMEPLRTVATRALISGEFEFAAHRFLELGKSFQDLGSLETSARLFQALGQTESAVQAWSVSLELTPKSEKRVVLELKLALSYESLNQDAQASRFYKLCLERKSGLQAECGLRLAHLYLRNQNHLSAQGVFRKVASLQFQSKKQGYSPYVGYARYELAQILEKGAQFESLKLPEAQLQRAVAQRLKFLESLSVAYQSAMEAGGPWAIAALNSLGRWLNRFADEVDQVVPPAHYQKDSLDRFRRSLAAVSHPVREKARTALQNAYAQAVEFQTLSPALPEVVDQLVNLNVKTLGQAQGVFHGFRVDGHSSSEELKGVRERLMKDTQDGEAWTDYGNMLWMEKKPRLAQLAYEKALSLNRTNLLALNNWAVMSLLIAGDAPWDVAAEAKAYWNEALEKDEFYRPAQFNLAILYNYYRLFPQAKILLDQVKVKESSAGVDVSSAVALQGLGKSEQAVSLFQEVRRLDAPKKDFIQHYHAAVREPEECLSHLKQIDLVELQALEKSSYERLKQFCETQKIKGSP